MAEYLRPIAAPSTSIVELRHASTDHVIFVTIPERRLLVIDGIGKLRAADYQFAASVLADVHRALRARLPRERFATAGPTPLAESLWWPLPESSAADIPDVFAGESAWHWRQMIELQRRASEEHVVAAIDEVRRKAGRPVPLIRSWSFVEGQAGQLLHVGGYDGLGVSVGRLFDGIAAAGQRPVGGVHLLFLADPDRVPPGRGRVIIRQPIA
jgi:hypothetical protein